MADPVSLIVLGAAVGGAAGKLAEASWEVGQRWLESYFKGHHPTAMEAATANAAVFLADLARRLEALESSLEERGESKERILNALDDPDIAADLQTAMISAARSSEQEKHELLARAVAERITAPSNSLRALTCSRAVEAVKSLSSLQLRLLAVLAVIERTRPLWIHRHHEVPNAGAEFTRWLLKSLYPYRSLAVPDQLIYAHLVSVGCAINIQLAVPLIGRIRTEFDWDRKGFEASAAGEKVKELSDAGMAGITGTPTGVMVGIYVHDSQTKLPTDLSAWDQM